MWSKVEEIKEKEGEEVKLRGWVYRERSTKNMAFIVLRDSTGTVQCVFKKDSEGFEEAKDTLVESSVTIRGIVRKDERAPNGFEIEGKDLKHIQKSKKFPITEQPSESFLMDVRHLWLRSEDMRKIMKGREDTINLLRDFFKNKDFHEVHPPIITQAGVEGGSTLFDLDYFGETAYLTQSSQLYLEAFMTVLENVYCLAPSFRAEKSRTSRHLTEYWHLEAEMAWYRSEDNIELQEQMISHVAQGLVEKDEGILKHFKRDPGVLEKIKPPFERISYTEAIERLQDKNFSIDWGEDFKTSHEKALTEGKEKPLTVYNYPKEIKPFYMPESNEEEKETVLCNDILAPEGHGEIIGGSERIWRFEELMSRIDEEKMDPDAYEWYIDLRKYGSVPHSGFGLGLERFIKWLFNRKHIKETLGFPRTLTRVYP